MHVNNTTSDINYLTLTINPKFSPYILDYSKRYNIYYGGRGSGKSHFIVDKLIGKALTSQRKVLFVRKYAVNIRDSVWQMAIESLSKLGILNFKECKVNISIFTIDLPNGSKLLFKGLDNPERAKGIHGITDIFIDEASELTKDEFEALDFSLRHPTAPHQQLYLAYNPVSKANWVYKYWRHKPDGNEDVPNTFYSHSTYKDNLFATKEDRQKYERLKETSPTTYQIIAEGIFASLDKSIYSFIPSEQIQNFKHQDIKGIYIYGLDFGYTNDPSAFVASKVDVINKTIYIFDEHYQTGMMNDAIANIIKYKGYSKEIIIADAAEPKSIDEIKRHGIQRIRPATKGQGSVLQGIQLLQQYKLIVHPSCEWTIAELQNYSWKKEKTTGEYINEPIDDYNHLMDALRYSIQSIEHRNTLQVANKSYLGL